MTCCPFDDTLSYNLPERIVDTLSDVDGGSQMVTKLRLFFFRSHDYMLCGNVLTGSSHRELAASRLS